jgi:hypothetical protein
MIDKRTGAAGATYSIGFAIALPQNWNGRFLLQGGGGLNGSVQFPLGANAAGNEPGLARGFAVASTDTGHEGRGGFDASFQQDQLASLDFAYVAIGRFAEIAKRIVAQHYGKPIDHSYFAGCSTGGREAMLMAERYPNYFDGVIAGSPAMRTSYSGIGDRWVAASLNEIAPKDDKGLPITKNALSESDKKTVIEGLINQCDALDGVKDRMIFNPKACHFDPKTLVCKGAKTDGCLSSAQAAALERVSPVRRIPKAVRSMPDSSSTPASLQRRASLAFCMADRRPSDPGSPTSAWMLMRLSTAYAMILPNLSTQPRAGRTSTPSPATTVSCSSITATAIPGSLRRTPLITTSA